jgi:hypothetical protein
MHSCRTLFHIKCKNGIDQHFLKVHICRNGILDNIYSIFFILMFDLCHWIIA